MVTIFNASDRRNILYQCKLYKKDSNCDEHFSKLVLNGCVSGPELLRASLIYNSAQQFRTRNAAIQNEL